VYSLFVDSTQGLVVGLLDANYAWVEYMSLDEKKPSEIIHFEIFNIISKHNLKLKDMRCFFASGPGSYTGMRLSEGLAQILEFEKVPVYSFYHFNVPFFCGISKGFWATNAFKSQVFIYNWNDEKQKIHLVNKDAFTIEDESYGYTLDANDSLFINLVSTKILIKNKARDLFSKVVALKLRVDPYYFRTLDEEFR
jgi:tRNA threonylcarbamoyladenosine biosynthesis protein TsaB